MSWFVRTLTSSSGVLMSMCSKTMNSFFTLTGRSHGRCSSALTQYLTLPCFPSKEVASALTEEREGGGEVGEGGGVPGRGGGSVHVSCYSHLRQVEAESKLVKACVQDGQAFLWTVLVWKTKRTFTHVFPVYLAELRLFMIHLSALMSNLLLIDVLGRVHTHLVWCEPPKLLQ